MRLRPVAARGAGLVTRDSDNGRLGIAMSTTCPCSVLALHCGLLLELCRIQQIDGSSPSRSSPGPD